MPTIRHPNGCAQRAVTSQEINIRWNSSKEIQILLPSSTVAIDIHFSDQRGQLLL